MLCPTTKLDFKDRPCVLNTDLCPLCCCCHHDLGNFRYVNTTIRKVIAMPFEDVLEPSS